MKHFSSIAITPISSFAVGRFVIAGKGMARAYVPGSADVFYFDSAFGLDHETVGYVYSLVK